MRNEVHKLRMLLLAVCLVCYPLIALMALWAGLHVAWAQIVGPLAAMAFFVPCIGFYCEWRKIIKLGALAELVGAMLFLAPAITISTYVAMKFDMPLADGLLSRLDAEMGVDWQVFIRDIDSLPLLARTLGYAYQSFAYQLLLIPVALVFSGHEQRAYTMVTCFALTGFVSALVSAWFPALGTYVSYGIDPQTLSNIFPYFGYAFLNEFNAVRDDPNFIFTLATAQGIVTFPSVHAATAALCAWAAWPSRYLRYPLLSLNVLMGISAVTHANHYVADVLAGVLLAAASVCLVRAYVRSGVRRSGDASDYLAPATR